MPPTSAPTPQEAALFAVVGVTLFCFGFALACIASDHALPWLESWWHDGRWTNYEHRCGYGDCVLREFHSGPHDEKDYD